MTDDPETMDVQGAIEQTLHDLLDCGATAEDLRQIMGLEQEDDIDPDYRDTDDYISIDLGYCIEGDLLDFEKLDPESRLRPSRLRSTRFLLRSACAPPPKSPFGRATRSPTSTRANGASTSSCPVTTTDVTTH